MRKNFLGFVTALNAVALRNDVQLGDKEFPDIKAMFFPETVKKDEAGE